MKTGMSVEPEILPAIRLKVMRCKPTAPGSFAFACAPVVHRVDLALQDQSIMVSND